MHHLKRFTLSILIIVLSLVHAFSQENAYYYGVTPEIKRAYNYATSLRLEQAQVTIDSIYANDPNNLLVLHIENYLDFFRIFINESKSEFDQLLENRTRRLKKLEQYGDKNSPYHLFVQAEIELQWSAARAKFKQLLKAGSGSLRAYRLLKKNTALFPDFIANKKSLSAIHVVSETIPSVLKFIFSVEGSLAKGLQEIEEVVNYAETNDFLYRDETIAIYTYILFFQNNEKQKAWKFLQKSNLDPKSNPFACFLLASIAQKISDNETVIEVLKQRPRTANYAPFYYLDFMEGKAKLSRLDKDANVSIQRFIDNFKGRHYIKEAYQKLAWYELVINEDPEQYQYYLSLCKKYGYDLVDEDKQALKEAKNNTVPNIDLLKARLLFDGGYFEEAYKILKDKAYTLTRTPQYALEYYYRLGRISQSLKNEDEAIKYYKVVLHQGIKSKSYLPCSSALNLGLIYEKKEAYSLAKQYFDKCNELKPDQYRNSLHQKANSGLQRIKEVYSQ